MAAVFSVITILIVTSLCAAIWTSNDRWFWIVTIVFVVVTFCSAIELSS